MEFAEKMILSKFKNTLNDMSFPNLVFDDFNFKSESSSTKKESKTKDRIFICAKVPKNKKIEEMQKMFSHNTINNADYSYYNHGTSIKDSHLIQQENFIHLCLDSRDPNDLTKMIVYFNNTNDTSTISSVCINDSIRNNSNEKIFNVSFGGGYDLNNNNNNNANQYYHNIKNIKENLDMDFKAYGYNSIHQEMISGNSNCFDNKEGEPAQINQEEEGQYFIKLLNDNFKPKLTLTHTPTQMPNTNHNTNINSSLNYSIESNNFPQSTQYFYNLQSLQRNKMRSINNQQSAFTNLNPNPNMNPNSYLENIFKQILNQQNNNSNPQFYQQFIP